MNNYYLDLTSLNHQEKGNYNLSKKFPSQIILSSHNNNLNNQIETESLSPSSAPSMSPSAPSMSPSAPSMSPSAPSMSPSLSMISDAENIHKNHHLMDSHDSHDSNDSIEINDSMKTNDNSTFKCDWPDCLKSFCHEENLIRHRRYHIRKSLYHCENCGLRFLDNEELQNHLVEHNDDNLSNNSNDSPNCDQNKTKFLVDSTSNNQMTDDQMLAAKGHNFKKNICNFGFNNGNQNGKSVSLFTKKLFKPVFDDVANHSINGKPEEYKKTRYSGVGR